MGVCGARAWSDWNEHVDTVGRQMADVRLVVAIAVPRLQRTVSQ